MRARTVTEISQELSSQLSAINIAVRDKKAKLARLTECQENLDRIRKEITEAIHSKNVTLNDATQQSLVALRERFDVTQEALTAAIRARGKIEHASPFIEEEVAPSSSRKRTDRDTLPGFRDDDGFAVRRGLGMHLPPEGDDEDEELEDVAEEHFFATTVKEFEDKAQELKAFNHKELDEYANLAGRTILAREKMEDSASTPQQRRQLQEAVKQQLNQLREISAFLQDCIRLHAGSKTDPENPAIVRYEGLLNKYRDSTLITPAKVQDQINIFAIKIEELKEADRFLISIAATGATASVYYANLNKAVPCATFAEAQQRATAFLGERAQIDPNAHVAEAGINEIGSTRISKFRFIATEVETNKGKQAVAIIQETNASKSYSKQTVLTPGDTIAKLKKAGHDDQMKFVAHLIETQLAAITTNGPIRISRNWDPTLAKAAAIYAKAMGYDFQPKEYLVKVKATEVADYLSKNKTETFMLEAIARRDAKNNTVSSPRFKR